MNLVELLSDFVGNDTLLLAVFKCVQDQLLKSKVLELGVFKPYLLCLFKDLLLHVLVVHVQNCHV